MALSEGDDLDAALPRRTTRSLRVFAPEAHLPSERRLIVDGSGVTVEAALGIRRSFPWSDCEAVLCWPDRAEIVFNPEVSLMVRATDWHLGQQAVRSIQALAPPLLVVMMQEDPEPSPELYVLRGLARSSGTVLIIFTLAAALVALLGVSIAFSDHRWQSGAVSIPFAWAAATAGTALHRRLRVPARWREAAALRGRTSVRMDSQIARSSDLTLRLALIVTCLITLAAVAVPAARGHAPWIPVAVISALIATAIMGELRRRGHR